MMRMTIVITIMIIIIITIIVMIIVITIITRRNFTAVRRRITDQILSLKGSTYRVKKENSGSCRQVQSNTSSLQRQQHHCR